MFVGFRGGWVVGNGILIVGVKGRWREGRWGSDIPRILRNA